MKAPTPERPWYEIEPDKDIACPHCDFSSGMRGGSTCSKCNGTGMIKEKEYFSDFLTKGKKPSLEQAMPVIEITIEEQARRWEAIARYYAAGDGCVDSCPLFIEFNAHASERGLPPVCGKGYGCFRILERWATGGIFVKAE
jgi:DnaJ-class molecular chaperone with C-terminal Zn finger domain